MRLYAKFLDGVLWWATTENSWVWMPCHLSPPRIQNAECDTRGLIDECRALVATPLCGIFVIHVQLSYMYMHLYILSVVASLSDVEIHYLYRKLCKAVFKWSVRPWMLKLNSLGVGMCLQIKFDMYVIILPFSSCSLYERTCNRRKNIALYWPAS